MDNAIYTGLTRQSGLMRQMATVANNIANASTTGYRREGTVFAEQVVRLDGKEPSLSMATATARTVDLAQGGMERTGGTYDFAIEGAGFFLVQTPQGDRLTRAGSFTPGPDGLLTTADGNRLLDAGGTPVFAPADARNVTLAADGTLAADDQPIAQIGLYQPVEATDLVREGGTLFRAENGVEAAPDAKLRQGYVEQSNVDPVREITRMIEVQRAYEMGQGLLDREDQRIRGVIDTLGR